ncbi:MAG: tetratricopeptide repeat protein [Proteobacteria bacterium]|nr:tetratricopeptide repeat protein [Pseudomonadota bacterium]
MNAVAWTVIAGLSLWPFGSKNDDADVETIDSLDRQKPVLVEKDNPDASGQNAIRNYREFLRLYPDDPDLRAEAMRRLADLQLEAGEERMIEGDLAMSQGIEYRDAVHLYESLLKQNPTAPNNDRILYQLARAYENTNQTEKALAALDQLVGQYPDSPMAIEAQFRRGEILFVAKRYYPAQQAYAGVVAGDEVEPVFGWLLAAGPALGGVSAAEDPLAGLERVGPVCDASDEVLLAGGVAELDGGETRPAGEQVDVGVDETRYDHAAGGVEDRRVRADEGVVAPADVDESAVADGGERGEVVAAVGPDACVLDDEVCGLGVGADADEQREERHDRGECWAFHAHSVGDRDGRVNLGLVRRPETGRLVDGPCSCGFSGSAVVFSSKDYRRNRGMLGHLEPEQRAGLDLGGRAPEQDSISPAGLQ